MMLIQIRMDSFTLTDVFKSYPYKDKDIAELTLSSINSKIYVKKSEIVSDHEYSITYKEFKEILTAYTNVVLDYLGRGRTVELPFRLGTLRFIKYLPSSKPINWKLSKEVNANKNEGDEYKFIRQKNYHTDGNIIKLKWDKKSRISGSQWFKARIARRSMAKLLKEFEKDSTKIYKIQEI